MILSLFFVTPFSLVSLISWACVRTVTLATQAWWELLMAIVGFFLDLCSNFIVWALAILTLPLRLFTALHREIKLEGQLREMKTRLENLARENKELEQCLLLAVKETNIVEKVYKDIEDEYETAIAKISLLENEIHELKSQGREGKNSSSDIRGGLPSRIGESKEGSVTLEDIMVRGQPARGVDDNVRRKGRRRSFPKGDEDEPSPEEQKMVAFGRSAFSSALSLLVGLIIWEAEDPCMPLVTALFTVVGMSLTSVLRFFFTIKNKPASDAVVLLSINCFMLGTITRPALPRVLLVWSPRAMRAAVTGPTFHQPLLPLASGLMDLL